MVVKKKGGAGGTTGILRKGERGADVTSVRKPITERQAGEGKGGERALRWVCFMYHCSISEKKKWETAQLSREKRQNTEKTEECDEDRKEETVTKEETDRRTHTCRGKTTTTAASHHAVHLGVCGCI